MHEYDLIAEWYATDRDHGTGIPEVTALSDSLPRGATVLDVGCGTGIPVTRALMAAGHSVLGVDSSTEMLRRFQVNCPGTPFIGCPSIDPSLSPAVKRNGPPGLTARAIVSKART